MSAERTNTGIKVRYAKFFSCAVQLSRIIPDIMLCILDKESWSSELLAFWEDWCLTSECFQYFSCSYKPVTTFSNADVETELLNADVTHNIFFFCCGLKSEMTLHSIRLMLLFEKTDAGWHKNFPVTIYVHYWGVLQEWYIWEQKNTWGKASEYVCVNKCILAVNNDRKTRSFSQVVPCDPFAN